jgi:hypothetical protein
MDDDWFLEKLRDLDEASKTESDRIRYLVSQVVPTYHYTPEKETAGV